MATAQRMDPPTCERLADFGDYLRTELRDGVPVEKPVTSHGRGDALVALAVALDPQLDRTRARLRVDRAKLASPGGSYFIPDIAILPASAFGAPEAADLFHAPAFLVVEVWSPNTGDYDIDVKLPGCLARGDAEIWRLHPFDRTLTRRMGRPAGGYR